MKVTVLLFGPQATLAREREVAVEVDEPTAESVLKALGEAVEPIAATLPASRLAVNHEFVANHHKIRAGDEVALIGMVSGG